MFVWWQDSALTVTVYMASMPAASLAGLPRRREEGKNSDGLKPRHSTEQSLPVSVSPDCHHGFATARKSAEPSVLVRRPRPLGRPEVYNFVPLAKPTVGYISILEYL